jgi:transposase
MDMLLTMSKKEITRLEVMQRIQEKRYSHKEAAHILGLSIRHVRRLYRAYREQGAQGLVSQRRGKPSNNRLAPKLVQQVVDLIYERYRDFGPTLAHEKLTELHSLQLSRESVRRIMIAEGIWKAKKARKLVVHQMRERRACIGELVQIDGSEHGWFEGRGARCTLLIYVDDATGQLMELRFVPRESFFAYCEATRQYLESYGKPVAFYSDKHGIFRVNQPQPLGLGQGLTQFGRAMKELDIEILCANTAQAKGRVERAGQTLQDRLVKELRLHNISDPEAGNAYLPEFRADYNRRFAVIPRSTHNAHRSLLPGEDLELILTHQETRILSKNLTVQFHKVTYQIQIQRPTYAMRNAQVTVCLDAQGKVTILYKGKSLAYTIFHKQVRQAEVVSSKSLDHKLRTLSRPAADHPWRKYGYHLNGKPIQDTSAHGSD